jgi:hypothetical protein
MAGLTMSESLPKEIRVTRTVIYDVEKLVNDIYFDEEEQVSIERIADTILDWAVEDMTQPLAYETCVITDETGKEYEWLK